MMNHRKLFFVLFGDDSLSDDSNEFISGQFINMYNKPNDFYRMNRILFFFNVETVFYSNQQLHLLMFHDTVPDCYHYR